MAHARGTVTFAVGALKNGNAPKRFASKMNSATAPTIGTYFFQSWPAFSSRTSLMPNPIGFVSSSSAICCEAPGRSTDKRALSKSANTVPTTSTVSAITTCSGIGVSG